MRGRLLEGESFEEARERGAKKQSSWRRLTRRVDTDRRGELTKYRKQEKYIKPSLSRKINRIGLYSPYIYTPNYQFISIDRYG